MPSDTPIRLSRRQILAGLGTIGVASAGAGLGTTAFFSDEESFTDNQLTAGRLDLKLDYRATYVPGNRATPFGAGPDDRIPGTDFDGDGGDDRFVLGQVPDLRYAEGDFAGRPYGEQDWGDAVTAMSCDDERLVDGDAASMFALGDVKPGDEGEFTMSLHHCDNPAYLWMRADRAVVDGVVQDRDSGVNEPEADAGDPDAPAGGVGELDDYLYVEAFYDLDCDNRWDAPGELDLVLAVDVSGSMLYPQHGGLVLDPDGDTPNGRPDELRTLDPADEPAAYRDDTYKIDLVEEAVTDFATRMLSVPVDTRIGVVFFGSPDQDDFLPGDPSTSRPSLRTVPFTDDAGVLTGTGSSGALDDLRYEVAGPGVTGTNLPGGIDEAQAMLAGGRPGAEKVMVVLGDGGQHGTSGARTSAASAKADGSRVISIAFGSDADDALLRDVASDPESENFYDVESDGATLLAAIEAAFRGITIDLTGDVPLYRGSLAGFLDSAAAGVHVDPVGAVLPRDSHCLDPGVNCIALAWSLPGSPAAFAALASDAVETDTPVNGEYESLADELAAKGLPYDEPTAVNVVQGDTVAFDVDFAAIQCRHNPENQNPFAPAE